MKFIRWTWAPIKSPFWAFMARFFFVAAAANFWIEWFVRVNQ